MLVYVLLNLSLRHWTAVYLTYIYIGIYNSGGINCDVETRTYVIII